MSTNGNAQWTNHLHIDTLTASTITSESIFGSYMSTTILSTNILIGNEMMVTNMVGETITGNIIQADMLSTLQNTLSSIAMNPATYTTPTSYTNTGTNTVSSMLINMGGTMWKIPIELA
jgi:hypothetical protein